MTEFSGLGGRVSNDEFPFETADEQSLEYPNDDDTTADDLGVMESQSEDEPDQT